MSHTARRRRMQWLPTVLMHWLSLLAFGHCAAVNADGLPKSVAQAVALESSDAIPTSAFYLSPEGSEGHRPGDLIRAEAWHGYSVPSGVKAVRILYESRSAPGADVVASGVILIPNGVPPSSGWPVIAWAHGTSGVATQCAPSLMKDVYYGDEGLFPMVRAGYAVVAPDYAGLGTSGAHQYFDKTALAEDVVNAVIAARVAAPSLGIRWVVDGHSEGGFAAWGVAELERTLHDSGYLGAVSVAGAAELPALIESMNLEPETRLYVRLMAFGIYARFPAFSPVDMLTKAAMQRYQEATSDGCWYYNYAITRDEKGGELRLNWRRNRWVQKFFRENELAAEPIDGPLLVIAGGGDRTEPAKEVLSTAERACRRGIALYFREYRGLDHDPTMFQSTAFQLRWIRRRFSGLPAHSNCGDLEKQGIRMAHPTGVATNG